MFTENRSKWTWSPNAAIRMHISRAKRIEEVRRIKEIERLVASISRNCPLAINNVLLKRERICKGYWTGRTGVRFMSECPIENSGPFENNSINSIKTQNKTGFGPSGVGFQKENQLSFRSQANEAKRMSRQDFVEQDYSENWTDPNVMNYCRVGI